MRVRFSLRFLTALLSLAIFGAVFYLYASYTPHSEDLTAPVAAPAAEAAPAALTGQEETQPAAASQDPEPEAEPDAEPSPEPTVDPNSPAGRAAALGLPAPPDIDITSWEYVLVNAEHSIDQYVPEKLAYLNQTAEQTDIQEAYNPNRCPVDARIAQNLLDMAVGCREAGLPVFLSSGYRSYSDQAANFRRVCENNGISDGKNYEGYYITMPAGCSEHQTGLGIDITDRYREIKNDSIAETATVQWLAEHCGEYGFILRFPTEKRAITQVMGESWHFRYVGVEAAAYMKENDLCLEEFVALYGVE